MISFHPSDQTIINPNWGYYNYVAMNDTRGVTHLLLYYEMPVKAVLSMTPCLLFLYVNGVMLFTLMRKPFFQESSRYVLFGHLLLSDSLNLLIFMVMYLVAVTRLKMMNYVCVFVATFCGMIAIISPLNLSVMSLERYIAICFPLRHSQIITNRRTSVAIAVMWVLGSLGAFAELFVYVSLESKTFTMKRFCTKYNLSHLKMYTHLNMVFTIVYFVIVGVIIMYTYICITIAARSASSYASTANKAHKTVLIHLLQLCLCLISTLFNIINSMVLRKKGPVIGLRVQYVLFLGFIIFPRCLSPLIYGLRDQAFRHFFKYYFTFGVRHSVKPVGSS